MSLAIRFAYAGVWFIVVVITFLVMGVLPSLFKAIWFAAFYLTLTLPARTLRVSSFGLLFFAGLLVVSHLTLAFQFTFTSLFLPPLWSNDGRFWHTVFLAPITEEFAKLAALLILLLIWKINRARLAFGATDVMLCGLAIGIGLNMFEDMLIGSATITTPGIVTNILVPWTEMQTARGRPDVVFIGHAASAAFIGLALGWARYLPRVIRYLPTLLVWLWMIWSHALYNGQDEFARGHLVFFTAPLTWITPYIFFIAASATAAFEAFLLHYRVTPVEYRNLTRRLAYARLWLRRHPRDRAQAERGVTGIIAALERD
ncbi:MAG: PrsW family intramembrane metalloprotease [Chloroflexi bacterium]|nr:PrsW family intramembrane metalloprotease [Chloroflexota bacterium]